MEKALLLYSGGLDTSVMVRWIKEKMNMDVVTLTLDIGNSDLEEIKEKALKLGAIDAITLDVKKEFADNYISREIHANGLYGEYPLSTALARPLMAEKAVSVANENDIKFIAHGSTGKGNDQVRFEVSINALDNNIKVIAPVREWNMTRADELEYAKMNNIYVKSDGKYSVDENIWGRSIEGSSIENINEPVNDDAFEWVTPPQYCGSGEPVSIEFYKGLPSSLNGKSMDLLSIIKNLNIIAGRNGIGIINMIESRLIGLKSHEVYECPAASVILKAHKYLENLILNKNELSVKNYIDNFWSNMVYNGLWFDPSMEHMNQFEKSSNQYITGSVNLRLYRGNMILEGIESPYSLYDYNTINYETGVFDQGSSKGFIDIYKNETVRSNRVKKALTVIH
ncbi:argininosuccinate synthase [Picrophilus oshimae]|uniref:Argininosuccinate synthase n=1 Tax=Picrophilus torridus (strain ATCC 700027 / DSM 9790 / JCM 10055 / NBRC 100828 / KAW 2/3) TaxID=1122961 RepID=ASSY_PICTO|nr:argininosuccinate synthase [Picrophilus oshimae]Q6L1N7.1 RecName: Full=Argininosuccinate synthase; AltName: Full=Citrulline--aspartate ligase [Picrophilus oshimae DSM 9789]AAT43115.1 argininosuccinate synthase [Picrophilus oshimae DSM 9789]